MANILPAGAGILPFGFPSSAADGAQHCLSAGPTGLSEDLCTGPSSGNFGTLKIKLFTTPCPYNGCNPAPVNSVLALNIAAGVDHPMVPLANHDLSNEVKDVCYNSNVNTLQSDPGFPSGTESGLATGVGLPAGETALLQQNPQNTNTGVVGYQLDDAPLWDWLVAGLDYGGGSTAADPTDDAPLFATPPALRAVHSMSTATEPTSRNSTSISMATVWGMGWPPSTPGNTCSSVSWTTPRESEAPSQ